SKPSDGVAGRRVSRVRRAGRRRWTHPRAARTPRLLSRPARGERIAGGVLGALTFTALNSISLLYLHARYTPSWYADHVLALLPFAALLAGQLWLYSASVLAERSAASAVAMASERRRIGLDIAK